MSVAGEKAHVQAMSSGAVVRLSWFAQCLVPPNWTTGANHPVIRMVARVTCVRGAASARAVPPWVPLPLMVGSARHGLGRYHCP